MMVIKVFDLYLLYQFTHYSINSLLKYLDFVKILFKTPMFSKMGNLHELFAFSFLFCYLNEIFITMMLNINSTLPPR